MYPSRGKLYFIGRKREHETAVGTYAGHTLIQLIGRQRMMQISDNDILTLVDLQPGQCHTLESGVIVSCEKAIKCSDPRVLVRMKEEGGHFTSALGTAWLHADLSNQRRLMDAFSDVYLKYEEGEKRRG